MKQPLLFHGNNGSNFANALRARLEGLLPDQQRPKQQTLGMSAVRNECRFDAGVWAEKIKRGRASPRAGPAELYDRGTVFMTTTQRGM